MSDMALVAIPKSKLDDLRAQLEDNQHQFTLTVKQDVGLTARSQLGQTEFVDILIHASSAVALHEIVNYIKAKVAYARVKKDGSTSSDKGD